MFIHSLTRRGHGQLEGARQRHLRVTGGDRSCAARATGEGSGHDPAREKEVLENGTMGRMENGTATPADKRRVGAMLHDFITNPDFFDGLMEDDTDEK